jgi:hypothetical protein
MRCAAWQCVLYIDIPGRQLVDIIYRVSFFKTLFDSTGHRADPCQGTVEVHGETRDDALENARQRFAKLKGIASWSHYADYHVVEALPERKRTSKSVWTKSIGDHALDIRRRRPSHLQRKAPGNRWI